MDCETCGMELKENDSGLCNNCWEVERRLQDYLRSANGRAKIQSLLEETGDGVEDLKARIMILNQAIKELRDDHNTAGMEKDAWVDMVEPSLLALQRTMGELTDRVEKLERKAYTSNG